MPTAESRPQPGDLGYLMDVTTVLGVRSVVLQDGGVELSHFGSQPQILLPTSPAQMPPWRVKESYRDPGGWHNGPGSLTSPMQGPHVLSASTGHHCLS